MRIPVFLVEFPNAAFRPDRLSDDEVEQMLFDPDDAASMAAFERAASNGRLRVEGDVFFYRAAGQHGLSGRKRLV